jgi:hypothetical protein
VFVLVLDFGSVSHALVCWLWFRLDLLLLLFFGDVVRFKLGVFVLLLSLVGWGGRRSST